MQVISCDRCHSQFEVSLQNIEKQWVYCPTCGLKIEVLPMLSSFQTQERLYQPHKPTTSTKSIGFYQKSQYNLTHDTLSNFSQKKTNSVEEMFTSLSPQGSQKKVHTNWRKETFCKQMENKKNHLPLIISSILYPSWLLLGTLFAWLEGESEFYVWLKERLPAETAWSGIFFTFSIYIARIEEDYYKIIDGLALPPEEKMRLKDKIPGATTRLFFMLGYYFVYLGIGAWSHYYTLHFGLKGTIILYLVYIWQGILIGDLVGLFHTFFHLPHIRKNIKLDPFAPDGCGGLSPIGFFFLKLAMMIFIGAAILGFRAIIFNIIGTSAESSIRTLHETILTFVLILTGFLIVFIPLNYISSTIYQKKDDLIKTLHSELEVFVGWPKNKHKLGFENIAAMIIYDKISNIKEYPIDVKTLRKVIVGGLSSAVVSVLKTLMPILPF